MNTDSTPIETLALRVLADPEACQTCGEPFAAPICSECFDERWSDPIIDAASAANRR